MWHLVLMQLKSSWKLDLFLLGGFVILAAFFSSNSPVYIFWVLLLRGTVNYSNWGQLLKLYSMLPLTSKDVVKARFVFEALSFFVYITVILTIIYIEQPFDSFSVLGWLSGSLILYGSISANAIYVDFSNMKNPDRLDYSFGCLPGVGLLIVHILLCALVLPDTFVLRFAIVPIISCIIFTWYYKRAVRDFPLKEIV